MVDLPGVSRGIVTSTPPESAVSRSDIAGQYDAMAGAMSKVADATMTIAEQQAKSQAAEDLQQQKVIRNPDNSVSVVNPANSLIFGRAGEMYQQAVKVGTIAQHSNIVSTEMNDLHQQYPTDPVAFNKAADSWKAKYLQDHGGGQVGLAIQQQADQLQAQHYNSITNTSGRIDLARQDSSLSAMQASARDDVLAMLRNGADIKDKAVQSRIAQYDSAIEARAANPLFAYSKEQAQLDRETFHSEAAGSRFLYNNDKIYQDQGENGGRNAALNHAKDILTNPDYKLTPTQRDKFYHAAIGQIRANEAIRHQDISEARAAAAELKFEWQAGGVTSDQVERVAKGFEAAGDPGGAAGLRASFLRKPLIDDHGNQPLATQTQQLMGLRGMNAVRGDVQYMIGKGYSPHVAAAIASHSVHESAGDPTSLINDLGKPSGGLFQFRAERLTALQQFAAAQGKPWTDRATQLDFVDRELHTTETATLAKLQAAKTPEEAAAAFYGYERPAGYKPGDATGVRDYGSRLQLARQIFSGDPGVSMGPAGSAWLIAHRQIALGDAATTQWKTIMEDYNKEGTRPSVKTIIDVDNAANASGNGALHDQIKADSERMNISGEFGTTSLPAQHADLSAMKAAGERGELPPALAALQKDLQRRTDAITKGLSDNPQATGAANLPTQIREQPPLDWSSDQNVIAGLGERGRNAKIIERNWEPGGAVSALDAPDVAQVKGLLATASPDNKMRIFGALATLPEDVFKATMDKLGQDTLTTFAGSMVKDRPELAHEILRGAELMNIDKTGDKGSLVRPAFQNKIGGDLYPSAQDQNNVTNAALAVYTARRGTAGALYDPTDTAGIEKAIEDVTGKITKRNGVKVAVPIGMTEAQFDRTLSGINEDSLAPFGGAFDRNGKPFDPAFLGNRAVLKQLGPGSPNYVVGLPDATARDGFAPVMTGGYAPSPLVIDVKQLAATQPAPAMTPYQAGRAAYKAQVSERFQEAIRQSTQAPVAPAAKPVRGVIVKPDEFQALGTRG